MKYYKKEDPAVVIDAWMFTKDAWWGRYGQDKKPWNKISCPGKYSGTDAHIDDGNLQQGILVADGDIVYMNSKGQLGRIEFESFMRHWTTDAPERKPVTAVDALLKGFLSGAKIITEERARQIFKEGFTHEHDLGHDKQELAFAALCYLAQYLHKENGGEIDGYDLFVNDFWPDGWRKEWFKDKDPLRCLAIAGGLAAAEIDRYQVSHAGEKINVPIEYAQDKKDE